MIRICFKVERAARDNYKLLLHEVIVSGVEHQIYVLVEYKILFLTIRLIFIGLNNAL